MDMHSRNQYLLELRLEYLKTKSKKRRGYLLDEAVKRTRLSRKHLVVKLRVMSNMDRGDSSRKKRERYYNNAVKPALIKMWEAFDYPCGQRLETSIGDELDRLRKLNEINCSDIIAIKLKQMGSATIDRLLKHEKEIDRIRRKYYRKRNPLLYQKIPVKVFQEQDRSITGNVQIDLVEHCGSSASGEFINTLSTTDISSGWWEGEAIMGKGRERTFQGLQRTRNRYPFNWKEIHSDNGTEFIKKVFSVQ
ncbi:MAG: hypothetical protein EOM67_15485 [Spirochaetia bacterium]|nr:hypothetical protein [Spirochaetia bacterium]